MNINKNNTMLFYATYVPCRCGNCEVYYQNIEKLHPEICEYLKKLGVDPLKPIDLLSINLDGQSIEFTSCQYVVFGTIEEDYKKEIGGIIIKKDNYKPYLRTDNDYFVISFGTIKISEHSNDRHVSREEKIDCILQVINKYDPINITPFAPEDEYYQEAALIESELRTRNDYTEFEYYIHELFIHQFGEKIEMNICKKMSKEIMTQLSLIRKSKH